MSDIHDTEKTRPRHDIDDALGRKAALAVCWSMRDSLSEDIHEVLGMLSLLPGQKDGRTIRGGPLRDHEKEASPCSSPPRRALR